MTDDDKAKFVEALSAVYALYRVDLSRAVTSIWWRALQGYELVAVVEALGRHAVNPDTGQFLPKPADVVRVLDGATQDVALVAWHKVVNGIRQVGTYESVVFDDPIINRVLHDLGGWAWLGAQQEREMSFIEKRFRDAYRAWRSRGLSETVGHLPGITETHNVAKGFGAPTPVFIGGKKEKAIGRAPTLALA